MDKTETIVFPVRGMSCTHCSARVEKALSKVRGVDTVSVSLEDAQATVTGRAGKISREALREAIVAAGYETE